MASRTHILAIFAFVFTSSLAAYGKTIYFGESTETVPVAYGSATILRFEEPVKTISNAENFVVKPVNAENPDYGVLSVEPRVTSGKFNTVFILASGDMARLKISVVPRSARMKLESVYDIKSKKDLIESRAEFAPYIGRLELITAMIRGDQVTGYDITTPGIDLSSGSESTKVSLVKIYSGEEFKGYVYEIKNLSTKKTFDLDVRKLCFGIPNQALLAFSDRKVLEKEGSRKNQTRLIVVAKATSLTRDAVLPIRVSTKADKAQAGG